MKDIFKLTFVDKIFKLKLVLFAILFVIAESIIITPSLLLMNTWSVSLNIIGVILFAIFIPVLIVIAYNIFINKLVVEYYPNMKIGFKDLIFKGLALITIVYPTVIVSYIILVIMAIISYELNSLLISVVFAVIGIIYIYQLVVMSLALVYIVLDLIEDRVLGYKCVFRDLVGKIKKIRKYTGKVLVRVLLYLFIIGTTITVSTIALVFIMTLIVIATQSYNFYSIMVLILYIVAVISTMWCYVNCYHFLIIRYENVKKLLNS